MKKIKLTLGKFALIDEEDFSLVSKYKWCAHKHRNTFYADAWINSKNIRMHQFIMGKKSGFEIDHVNRNGLDNRRSNLRFCTHSQNLANSRVRKTRASSYRGVYYSKEKKKWRSYICVNYKTKFLGYFESQEEAAKRYNEMAKEIYGEFANLSRVQGSFH